jgi:hypothetical protein
MKALSVILAVIVPALAYGQATMSCPMHEQHESSSHHAARTRSQLTAFSYSLMAASSK